MENVKKRVVCEVIHDMTHPSPAICGAYADLLLDFARSKITGNPGFSSEAFHWKRYYEECKRNGNSPEDWYPHNYAGKEPRDVKNALKILRDRFGGDIKIADIGSGPMMTYNTLDITKQKVTPIDPLADVYNHLNIKYRTGYPFKCIKGFGESLNDMFGEDYFHMVIAQNAIDHSSSPKDFVDNMYNVLKPDGFLLISGFINEGRMKGRVGLHKHDMFIKRGSDDVYWTWKDGPKDGVNLTGNLKISAFSKYIEGYRSGSWFKIIYRKH